MADDLIVRITSVSGIEVPNIVYRRHIQCTEELHNILNVFEFLPEWVTDNRVTSP